MPQEKINKNKKAIAIDFDGVIHKYSKGWHDGSIYDIPINNTRKALVILQKKFKIVIFSRRAVHQGIDVIKKWMNKYKIPYDRVTGIKPRCRWYIDDKAITFTNWEKVLKKISTLEKNYLSKNRK